LRHGCVLVRHSPIDRRFIPPWHEMSIDIHGDLNTVMF
jgi:hypothetical protein